jgi:hypothetical protein
MQEGLGGVSMEMYNRAAAIYLQHFIVLFSNPTCAPPDGLRFNKNSGALIKAAVEELQVGLGLGQSASISTPPRPAICRMHPDPALHLSCDPAHGSTR